MMLAILTTHPIQYQVPLWRALAESGCVPFEVWYLTDHGVRSSFDVGFQKKFSWDLDMLAGYPHRFLSVNDPADVSRFNGVALRSSLVPLMRQHGVRALWVNGWQVRAYWQAVWQARRAGLKVWLRGESNDLGARPLWKRVARRVALGSYLRCVDSFLCIGSANRRMYESFGVPLSQMVSAPYGVDNARFAVAADLLRTDRMSLRSQWAIEDDAFCILFAGKFMTKKRPGDLIRAAASMHDRKVHLLFVGDGILGDKLRAECNVRFDVLKPSGQRAQSGRPSATFAGFMNQSEISKAYVAADCLALPSDHGETWGLVVNEAMASGLPCVVSDACGSAEDLVKPIAPDLCFSCGNVADLQRAIRAAMDAPPQKEALRERMQQFAIAETVEAVIGLWQHT